MQRVPQTHGEQYKYSGNYLELFEFMRKYLPAYQTEAPKLFKILVFNYLFSNGDAHLKNFSLLETSLGDSILSPCYDLLNSRIHVDDNDFALEGGLLPKGLNQGTIASQFRRLAKEALIPDRVTENILVFMTIQHERITSLINASFLDQKAKRSYLQQYQKRLMRLAR